MRNHPNESISRRALIERYIEQEVLKKNKPIPPGYEELQWDDPNHLDEWLEKYCYKPWVMSGFRKWEYVTLSRDDLLDCAIVNHIFENNSQRLGDLVTDPQFQNWNPRPNPRPIWYEALARGEFEERFAITLRAACRAEKKWGAKFYVEDGSGRSICYLGAIVRLRRDSEMTGYIGIEPDPQSRALQEKFNGEFSVNNATRYATFERLLEAVR